jgi:hypothetical protein
VAGQTAKKDVSSSRLASCNRGVLAIISENVVGSLNLDFLSCTKARVNFAFNGGAQGQIDLMRLTPEDVCEAIISQ